MIDAEPLLTVVALHWNMEPDRPDESIAMTLAAFAAQVAEAKQLFFEYWELSERCLRFARF